MLKGHTFIDLTHRLPGPLAGKILADMGATVIKIEDEKHKDPFLSGMFSTFDQSFKNWYEELNQKKQIIRLDFKSPEAKNIIRSYLEKADGAMLSLSPKLKSSLALQDEDLHSLSLAVVELEASSTHNKAMHDLNALALSGFLSLHVAHQSAEIIDPPFLPFAGIAFGQQVATQLLANVIVAKEKKSFIKSVSYLHDTAESIFRPFWSSELRSQKRTKFLHNGAYPCYSLYRLKDGHYLAVAAVEDKFWMDLIELFQIPLPLARRFETSPEAFSKVAQVFAKMDSHEVETRAKEKELCISIVRKIN
jgi:alpha-methylacyl-CoA racemase